MADNLNVGKILLKVIVEKNVVASYRGWSGLYLRIADVAHRPVERECAFGEVSSKRTISYCGSIEQDAGCSLDQKAPLRQAFWAARFLTGQ